MVTDIYTESTLFLTEGKNELAHVMGYPQLEPHLYELKGVLSRKKQMVPHLLKVLEDIARMNGYTTFMATVLAENSKMIKVFLGRYPHAKRTRTSDGEMEIEMPFL
jgi:hypothetical protein